MCGSLYRMGRKTSIYINPLIERLLQERPQPLPEALYRGLAVMPFLVEPRDGFTARWFCEPPPDGVRFQVVHDYWLGEPGDHPVREIYEIQVTQSSDE
jgi:hypothetical protein